VQKHIKKFNEFNVRITVISFADDMSLAPYKANFKWDMELVSDPTRKLYKQYGLKRGKILDILHPKTLLKYTGYILQGKKMKKPTEDIYQLGGDFILDAKGKVFFSYPSKHPEDRPSVKLLLKQLKKLT
jgi:peroxiredoxin